VPSGGVGGGDEEDVLVLVDVLVLEAVLVDVEVDVELDVLLEVVVAPDESFAP